MLHCSYHYQNPWYWSCWWFYTSCSWRMVHRLGLLVVSGMAWWCSNTYQVFTPWQQIRKILQHKSTWKFHNNNKQFCINHGVYTSRNTNINPDKVPFTVLLNWADSKASINWTNAMCTANQANMYNTWPAFCDLLLDNPLGINCNYSCTTDNTIAGDIFTSKNPMMLFITTLQFCRISTNFETENKSSQATSCPQ